MPLYEYRCKNCGHEFEIQQAISEDSLTVCPSCDQIELRKVFQPIGISFKGSGFYKNDSRSSTKTSSGSSAKSDSTSADTAKKDTPSSGASTGDNAGSGDSSGIKSSSSSSD